MSLKRMDLGWIVVSDLSKAKKFFNETLGLKLNVEDKNFNWLEFSTKEGGATLGVGMSEKEMPFQAGSNAILTFTVDNIEKVKADFEKKGVKFLGDIMEVPGHVKLATFVDPDNNTFQLVEVLNK